MKFGDQLVDLWCQGEAPVDVVLVRLVAAFLADLLQLLGKVVVVVGDAKRNREIAVVADLGTFVR